MPTWKKWKYKNLTLLFFGIYLAYFIFRLDYFHQFLENLQNFGYIGAFFAGVLFVSTFTIASGAVTLLILAEKLSAVELGIIAGAGAVFGDYLIFRFVRNDIAKEVEELYRTFGPKHLTHVLHSKYFSWFFPLFGAIIIASPLPDELGVSLLGI